jgi:putative SOS response-associated peptidase YedK
LSKSFGEVGQPTCIAADAFYEWKRAEKAKQPFSFGMEDDSLFAFAGLWDR